MRNNGSAVARRAFVSRPFSLPEFVLLKSVVALKVLTSPVNAFGS